MKQNGFVLAVAGVGAAAALLLALSTALSPVARHNADAQRHAMLTQLLPGSNRFTPETHSAEDDFITGVFKGDNGYILETTTPGYAGNIVLLVGVNNKGSVTGLVVRNLEETYGLGGNALWDVEFLSQFLHSSGNAAVGEGVDALTGATVTSKAIAKGVNAAVAFVTGADISSTATEWEG